VGPEVGTLPVYFGIMSIHQLMNYSGKVNQPIRITNFPNAVTSLGYNINLHMKEQLYKVYKYSNTYYNYTILGDK
jgi:hypothetical protein